MGTMPTRELKASSDAYGRGYHKGNPGGLDAVDTDLAEANIKQGVTIFGKEGSYAPTLSNDVENSARELGTYSYGNVSWYGVETPHDTETEICSFSITASTTAARICIVSAMCAPRRNYTYYYHRLYYDGTKVGESNDWGAGDGYNSVNLLDYQTAASTSSKSVAQKAYQNSAVTTAFQGVVHAVVIKV